jgi:uncharacterized membrane protein
MTTIADLAAPALLGAATGLRSQLGMAALVSRHDLSGLPQPWSRFGARRTQRMAQLAAGGELIADKLPTAPLRTEPGPLVARVAMGALVGLLADASARGQVRIRSAVPATLVAGSAAAATSVIGQKVRTRLSTRVPALAVAAAEDVLAITLAVLGTSRAVVRTSR